MTPRILAIMGSGETAPTMVSVHAELIRRLEPPPAAAVMLDTPFGFQENADEVAAKAQHYFAANVRHPLGVASYRSAATADALVLETAQARIREAAYVFAGPGSPSYTVRQLRGTRIVELLRDKLRGGGCVTFSSAAACTLGRVSLPVYEVYKVGMDPEWLEGLDLIAPLGIRGAVIPHFNNAEGGTHDTRYCYMGERRLRILESMLEPDDVVLGVDEHTALVADLGAGTATVRGNGVVTVRRGDVQRRFPAGTTVAIEDLRTPAGATPATAGNGSAPRAAPASAAEEEQGGSPAARGDATNPLLEGVEERRRAFEAALAARDVDAALAALLGLDEHLWAWSRDTLDSDSMDRGRAEQRTMLVQLADLARSGARDPREVLGPFVEAILGLRARARDERRFADADALRDSLVRLGVEIHDGRAGTGWELAGTAATR